MTVEGKVGEQRRKMNEMTKLRKILHTEFVCLTLRATDINVACVKRKFLRGLSLQLFLGECND
jgi:hypothetical protein